MGPLWVEGPTEGGGAVEGAQVGGGVAESGG